MNGWGHVDGCTTCATCGRHLTYEDTNPCLECDAPLCDSCDCTSPHLTEVTC